MAVSGDTVAVSISDLTRHTTVSKQLQMSSPTVSSAEWIAEAPSRCVSSSSQDCHILSLADFGNVTFTGASVSAGGRTGSLTSGLGAVSALTLEANPRLRPAVRHGGAGGRVARRSFWRRIVVHRHLAAPGDPDAGPACPRVRSRI